MSHDFLGTSAAFLISMLVHLVTLVVLAMWIVPQTAPAKAVALLVNSMSEPEKELETAVLDEQPEAATQMSMAVASGDPRSAAKAVEAMEMSEVKVDEAFDNPITITPSETGNMLARLAGKQDVLTAIPERRAGSGSGREVVDGYQEAIDRITREIMVMLYEGQVLVVWCFDQSGSMKDDQKEIRDRVERIYTELGLSDRAAGDALTTAVLSFGQGFQAHMKLPTSDRKQIREAIDAVPVDDSGKELMCQAVGQSIAMYRNYAVKTRRRMMLILVTDESGDPEDNFRFLEPTIAEAKAARCKIYVMGREAVFGYPYAYIRYLHPQTKRVHWLQLNRGPETGFVEQLQTDGFHRRYDAHPSGFGPYEQSRMARETGGIFFLLPSLETNLVRGEKRRYELEAMRSYLPDLRPREKIILDRSRGKLRTLLWTVICDLNPYNTESAKVIEMRVEFPLSVPEIARAVPAEEGKAKLFVKYLEEAAKQLERSRRVRDDEESPRWRANYDLMYGQLLAYNVRLHEYVAFLHEFVRRPRMVPGPKPPNLRVTHWHITTRKETLTGKLTASTIERATERLNQVVKEYPGTPWAARAQWELARGFGVDFYAEYEPPYPKVDKPSPLPKL